MKSGTIPITTIFSRLLITSPAATPRNTAVVRYLAVRARRLACKNIDPVNIENTNWYE